MIRLANENSSKACYLIGFSPREVSPGPFTELLNLFAIQHEVAGAIRFWFRLVDRSEFEGPIAEKNLADLQWLTPRVLAHEKAVEFLSQLGPVYPAKFGTLFTAIDLITELVEQNEHVLLDYFSTIEGKVEWGLKLLANWEAATKVFRSEIKRNESGKGSGTNYLVAKKSQRTRSPEIRGKLLHAANEFLGLLRENQVAFVSRTCRSHGNPNEEQLVNLSILMQSVDRSEVESILRHFIQQMSIHELFRAEFTGPWPTYSFCPVLQSPSNACCSGVG